jgi:hypothetical protein
MALFHSLFFMWICLLALTGCQCEKLTVYTDYLSHENLASYHVGTPDPRLNNPPMGQRLIISWSLPKNYLCYEDLHLDLTIRFRNKQQISEKIDICKRKGMYIYSVLNEDFFETKGLLTYKIDLVGDDVILEEWRHQLWTELITFEDNTDGL